MQDDAGGDAYNPSPGPTGWPGPIPRLALGLHGKLRAMQGRQVRDIVAVGMMLCARRAIRPGEECGYCSARDLALGRHEAAPSSDGTAVADEFGSSGLNL
jgi:hypothetical protein